MSIMDGQHTGSAAAAPSRQSASTSMPLPPRHASPATQTQLLRATSSSKTKSAAMASSSSSLSPSPSPSALASTSASSCATPSSSSSPTHSLTPSPIPPEPDKRGNLEYKLRILPVSPSRFSRLVTQLKWRLAEGGGLAVYEIGVLDDGTLIGLPREEMRSSLMQLGLMGERLGAGLEVRRCIVVERGGAAGQKDGEGEVGEGEAPPSPSSPADNLVPYRHRLGSSSKNQSPGLDNIVGLRSLNNAEAAKFLGHAQARTGTSSDDAAAAAPQSWRYEIAPQLSDSGNATAEDGGDDEQDSRSDDSAASDENDDGEDDGFAFSLSLSDDESKPSVVPPAGAQSKPKIRRRSSRSVTNSPWQRFASPNPSSAASSSPVMRPSSALPPSPARRPSAQNATLAAAPNGSSSSPMSTPPLDPHQPSDDASSSSPLSSSSRAAFPYTVTSSFSTKRFIPAGGIKGVPTPPLSRRSSFTDLAGMDVEGVLRFALPARVEKSESAENGGLTGRAASNARRRAQRDAKRAARRLEEEARKGDGVMNGDGKASSAPSATATPSTDGAKASSSTSSLPLASKPDPVAAVTSSPPTILPAPTEVLRLSLERKEAKLATATPPHSHPRIGRNSNSASLHKLERRRRREVEHLAKEREGAGELLAMAVEHELDLPDEGVLGRRSDWWRFSGLSLEGDLPGFDATKQGWVREVADWLTVKEVMELSSSTRRSGKLGGPGGASSSDADEEDEPRRRAAAVAAAAAAAIEAKIPAAVNKAAVDEGLSRRAQARRRKKDRKKQEEAAAAGLGAASSSLPVPTPSYTPPPPYIARPHYLPPPASAVAIPSSSAGKASAPAAQRHPRQSSSPLHPLARSQTFDDDDNDEEEEDSFSMGLTLNIDDFPDSMGSPTAAQRGAPTGSSTAFSTISATSPSPSSSTTTTATLMMGAAALAEKEEKEEGAKGGEQASSSSPEQAPAQMRFIVEAVLSLKAIQGRR